MKDEFDPFGDIDWGDYLPECDCPKCMGEECICPDCSPNPFEETIK